LKPGVFPHPKSLSPRRDFESFSGSPRPLGEGLGVRAKTTVLNMDLVYVGYKKLAALFCQVIDLHSLQTSSGLYLKSSKLHPAFKDNPVNTA